LELKQTQLFNELRTLALKLSQDRKIASKKLAQKWQDSVRVLGLEKCELLFELDLKTDFGPMGQDGVEILFCANPGETPKPLSKVASGGELSRLMLALKSLLANKSEIGVFLFDEIDTGIGGKAALRVAEKLLSLSEYNQVLVVSHLAPIAAAARNHFRIQKRVVKSKTVTEIDILTKDQRRHEIARMLGGIDTQSALNLADELVNSFSQDAKGKAPVNVRKETPLNG
jgi:DNA repair protein RecN (Recombination protein N)